MSEDDLPDHPSNADPPSSSVPPNIREPGRRSSVWQAILREPLNGLSLGVLSVPSSRPRPVSPSLEAVQRQTPETRPRRHPPVSSEKRTSIVNSSLHAVPMDQRRVDFFCGSRTLLCRYLLHLFPFFIDTIISNF